MTTDTISKARQQTERRSRERIRLAAEALRRGEEPEVALIGDELDRAEALARETEREEAREQLRDQARGILARGRERLEEKAEAVDQDRTRVRAAVDDLLDVVQEAEQAEVEWRKDRAELHALAEVAGLEREDLPSPTSTKAEVDAAVKHLDRRVRDARRESGLKADPGAPLAALRQRLRGWDADATLATLRSMARRAEDSEVAEVLASNAAVETIRERAEEHRIGRARGAISRAARRTGQAILEGRHHTDPDTFPAPLADLLDRVRLDPGAWTGHGSPDLDAEISAAVRQVDPAMAVAWARRYER